ncbi:unnamed protein product, partial [Bubo scandiacus]
MVEKPCRSHLESSNELSQHLATLCSGEQLYQKGCYLHKQIALNLTELLGRGSEKPAETAQFTLPFGMGSLLPGATGV